MSSMAVAATQKVAATAFTPYVSSPSVSARISLSADSGISSHAVAGNSTHRQGQQSPLHSHSSFRGAPLALSHTPPPAGSPHLTRGMARNSVQVVGPPFAQTEHIQALAARALLHQKLASLQQEGLEGPGYEQLPPFLPEINHRDQFFPSNLPESSFMHPEFGMDHRAHFPHPSTAVNSRYFAPFPGQHSGSAFSNDPGFRNEAPHRHEVASEWMSEDFGRMMAHRREQELDRPSTSFDRSLSTFDNRPSNSFFSDEQTSISGRPDAFASLANRLNNLALNQRRAANQDFAPRPFTASEHPRAAPQSLRVETQPFNAAIAGIVESLEKSLANSPIERNQDWGFSPRGQETHRNRFGEEVYGRNRDGVKGFDGLRDLDDVLPNGRQVDPTRVMVSGISWQMSAHQIREELVHRCSKLGKVVDIEVAQYRGNSPSQLDRGRHRGFAFVTMETPEQATLVMTALHKMDMGGMQVQTKPGVVKDPMFARRNYAKKKAEDVIHKPTGRKYVKVFVGNLWFGTDGERLRDAFQEYGLIVDTKVVRDKDSGESRGFGFVTFANESAAVEAIGARDGSLLDGRKLVVNVSRSWAGSNGEEESGSEGTPSEFSHDRH